MIEPIPSRPWLSILIPVYNVEAYLQECVESVLAQADAGVEVLMLDDVSTDGSALLMEALRQRWPDRIRLLAHPRNQGLSAARNTMLAACQGDYVWCLDSDDKLLPGAIAELRDIVSRHGPELVLCDFQLWRAHPRLKHRLRGEAHRASFAGPAGQLLHSRADLLAGMCRKGQMHAWSKVVRRSLWGDDLRFPSGSYFEDMATMPRLLLRARSWFYAPSVWVAYRQREGSIVSNMTLRKAADLSGALRVFSKELVLAQQEDPGLRQPRIAFLVSHMSARNYMGAMRFLAAHPQSEGVAEAARQFAQDFLLSSPLTPQQLLQAYRRHGWWMRYLRGRRWLESDDLKAAQQAAS
ncbi:glycosyltransferase family 2 protein [Corticibacter populi]|uniref:Glycosyltransferase family 2 protein n=1 Tax=Corticibacter populi TaxID=1550736 RepID=A0A3M6QMK8_9BURK|nr:glycosyltransferase family 2 protein [Corticibacter populi]RMX04185.1 glycosyltransferase family 2 protein [Corticibacter populi]RZS33207.1 glycosyltransferase involved in cell wall biosynthesis [Corticibacter populi]